MKVQRARLQQVKGFLKLEMGGGVNQGEGGWRHSGWSGDRSRVGGSSGSWYSAGIGAADVHCSHVPSSSSCIVTSWWRLGWVSGVVVSVRLCGLLVMQLQLLFVREYLLRRRGIRHAALPPQHFLHRLRRARRRRWRGVDLELLWLGRSWCCVVLRRQVGRGRQRQAMEMLIMVLRGELLAVEGIGCC